MGKALFNSGFKFAQTLMHIHLSIRICTSFAFFPFAQRILSVAPYICPVPRLHTGGVLIHTRKKLDISHKSSELKCKKFYFTFKFLCFYRFFKK